MGERFIKGVSECLKWLKWATVISLSTVTGSTVVDFFGSTYIVSRMTVKKVR